ncbi:MAG: protein phosphatase 2C domain-containing protein [Clostridia bacterium]|nr:protein phosphatase 2C domain-containing protein [Clostridia bacterium]
MRICRQGNGHYLNGLNNQDFCYMENNLKLVTDGCSSAEFSEVGTRLFVQAFAKLPNRFDVNEFEENVRKAFESILSITNPEDANDFIANNLLFTIIACFETEDKFIVKFIGDGYIITVNHEDVVSYTRLFYGKTPPYFAYTKIPTTTYEEPLKFKTFEYPKKDFKLVGIASDGIAPIADKKLDVDFDALVLGTDTKYSPEGIIRSNQSQFFDDITILI